MSNNVLVFGIALNWYCIENLNGRAVVFSRNMIFFLSFLKKKKKTKPNNNN